MTSAPASALDPRSLERSVRPAIGPWSPDHLVWLVVANLAGAAMIVTGWWVVSGSGTAHGQLGWLNLCVIGLLVAGGTNAWWLARGWRVVCLARQMVFAWPPGSEPGWAAIPEYGDAGRVGVGSNRGAGYASNGAGRVPSSERELVAGPGMSRYHRPSCALVEGKTVHPRTRVEHEDAGLAPCEVCLP